MPLPMYDAKGGLFTIPLLSLPCAPAALSALEFGLVRPKVVSESVLHVRDGWHMLGKLAQESFVTNDTHMSERNGRVMVVNGPNASGKSVYLKQVAIIAFLGEECVLHVVLVPLPLFPQRCRAPLPGWLPVFVSLHRHCHGQLKLTSRRYVVRGTRGQLRASSGGHNRSRRPSHDAPLPPRLCRGQQFLLHV